MRFLPSASPVGELPRIRPGAHPALSELLELLDGGSAAVTVKITGKLGEEVLGVLDRS